MYYLKARNNYTGIFMLDLIKPKSLTLYELVKNTEFLIEPFKSSSNATVNHIPNGFREVPGFLFYPIDPETRTRTRDRKCPTGKPVALYQSRDQGVPHQE